MRKLRLSLLILATGLLSGCASIHSGGSVATETSPGHYAGQLPVGKPKNIALLLPLAGGVANQSKAVQNGFFAAYYQDKQTHGDAPTISVINTSAQDIRTVYKNAVAKGADRVVGPLLKADVQTLQSDGSLTKPVIALNTTNTAHAHANFFMFALSPQDEAVQVADRAHRDGRHRAIIIVPTGAWGNGITNAFATRWRSLGDTVVETVTLSPGQNLEARVRHLLRVQGTVNSENNNATSAAPTLKRQDFDVIFMAVFSPEARQIMPLLKYYGAESIPVYATSLVYDLNSTSETNKDLNGVYFCDMPWIINHTAGETRLYAFGEDAYLIAEHLHAMANGHTLQGMTGKLYLAPNGEVKRDLQWAQITDGVATPVN